MREPGAVGSNRARSEDGIGKRELLAVSFGTSYPQSRERTIAAIEQTLEKAFPTYDLRRAFTSRVVISLTEKREGLTIDHTERALQRAVDNGVEELVVQPTHLLEGLEYQKLLEAVRERAGDFRRVAVGKPLLTSQEDVQGVARALIQAQAHLDDGETALVLMGHGTTARCNAVYPRFEQVLRALGGKNWFVGTVEADPGLEAVLERVREGQYRRVVLRPLMIVAGDHATNDMAGEEDSWKQAFAQAGYEVLCQLQGLGELEEVRRIFVRHAQEAMEAPGL
ncbi:sirohydrochlorin cobaltochelatase [Lawsonibacter sp. LCP25S3_G6]|uniref:sirohydrochlorin cobaltochelatase n=1 Tax=unclassified Lawsonibacter TaxID=2617946 RepID=UPI003F9DE48A